MTNPNLVPTVITDKNGKITTVHKILFETPTSPWSTPPPPGGWSKPKHKAEPPVSPYSREREAAPIGTEEERAATLAALSKLMEGRQWFQGSIRVLINCKDGDYLKRVYKAIDSVSPDDEITLVSSISMKKDVEVNFACEYNHLVTDAQDSSLGSLLQLHKELLKDGICETDENGCVKAFEAHLYARDNTVVPKGHMRMGRYGFTVDNEDYVALVDQYADNVHQLAAYVSERGYEDFDHNDFAEYLSNGPVSDGWL